MEKKFNRIIFILIKILHITFYKYLTIMIIDKKKYGLKKIIINLLINFLINQVKNLKL